MKAHFIFICISYTNYYFYIQIEKIVKYIMLQNPTKPQFELNASLQSASLPSKMKVDFQLNPLVVPLNTSSAA